VDVKLNVTLKVGDGTIYQPGHIFRGSFSSLLEDVRDLVKKDSPLIEVLHTIKPRGKLEPKPVLDPEGAAAAAEAKEAEAEAGEGEFDGEELAKAKTNIKPLKTRS